MTRELRARHRRMAFGMAMVVPVLIAAALYSRPTPPLSELPGTFAPSRVTSEGEADAAQPGLFRARVVAADRERWLAVERVHPLGLPDLRVFQLSANGRRELGAIDGRRVHYFRIPAVAGMNTFEVRSMLDGKLVSTFTWSPEP